MSKGVINLLEMLRWRMTEERLGTTDLNYIYLKCDKISLTSFIYLQLNETLKVKDTILSQNALFVVTTSLNGSLKQTWK